MRGNDQLRVRKTEDMVQLVRLTPRVGAHVHTASTDNAEKQRGVYDLRESITHTFTGSSDLHCFPSGPARSLHSVRHGLSSQQ